MPLTTCFASCQQKLRVFVVAVEDVIVIGVVLFVVAVAGLASYYAVGQIMERFGAVQVVQDDPMAREVVYANQAVRDKADYGFLVVFVGFILLALITAWFVAGNTLFSWIYGFIYAVFIALTPILSNVWAQVSTTAPISSSVAKFPITNHVLLLLPLYTAVLGFIILVILFMKPGVSSGALR